MYLHKLRIDELILPYMNGDSLLDFPTFVIGVKCIVYIKNNGYFLKTLPEKSTWADIFLALDGLLIEADEKEKLDLAGVSALNGVL
jgi:hypothetical protein